jgi:DNA-directed RNA polymerase subunit RPC12/RpoP
MKIQLDTVYVTRAEYELPEKCPACGVDFTEENSLKEEQLVLASQRCSIAADGKTLDDYDGGEMYFDCGDYTTGYRCARCEHVIVTREMVETPA